ncbi:MAG: electron transport complex subunit RsxE [Christensenellales bacterium]
MENKKKLTVEDLITPIKDGIIKNNPTFRLVLGTCPTLAVTTSAINGLSMGLAVTFVLICSNIIISMLRNFIPRKVRIPCYILIISTFSTVVDMVMKKFIPSLHDSLGLFIPLIVVNCILLARAEGFASLNKVLPSAMDGLGIGLGFTLALTIMGAIREFIGAGAIFGFSLRALSQAELPMTIFILPAGGFMVFGLLIVIFNVTVDKVSEYSERKKSQQGAKLNTKNETEEEEIAL